MVSINLRVCFAFLIVAILLIPLPPTEISGMSSNPTGDKNTDYRLTLISKSDGLENPEKEEGKTEYEVADVNNDGFLDIISVGDHGNPHYNSGEHGIMVWLGDNGNYWELHQTGNFGYGGCAIGDLNLDGYYDIAFGIHHNNSNSDVGDTILDAALGDGTGYGWTEWGEGLASNGETWGMFATALADFDLDGDLDIVSQSFGCCNGIRVYENHGDGTWSQAWAHPGGNVMYTMETCDFNGDGRPDFVATHEDGIAFLGDGNFGFTIVDNGLPVSSINAIDCGDMNNDGADDIAVALDDNGVRCYVFDVSTNAWKSKSTGLPTSGDYYLVQFGDINGDGYLDIVAYTGPEGEVYLGDGTGKWTESASWTMPAPGLYSAMRVDGDVDHDGREDIVIQAEKEDFPTYKNELRLYSPWREPTELSALVQIPHGGEVFRIGSVREIRWLSAVPPSDVPGTVTIQLSTNGTSGPWETIASNIPNNGRYQWIVSGEESSHCRIKIIVTAGSDTVEAISPDDFYIISEGDVLKVFADGPYHGYVNESIQFHGSAQGGTPPYTWEWDFGDGNTSHEQNPTHVYTSPGNYTVTLTVTDSNGRHADDTTTAYIEIPNIPPHAHFSYSPPNPTTRVSVHFTDESTDEDGTIVRWFWRFGDGCGSTERNPVHRFRRAGTYTVTLTVTDDDGATDSYQERITVIEAGNSPPVAIIDSISPNPAVEGETVEFSGHGEDIDGYITDYKWISSIDGFLSNASSFSTANLSVGVHTISFYVKDNEGAWSNATNTTLVILDQQPDTNPPYVRIIKPRRAIYLNGEALIPFFLTMVIGGIEIEIEAWDNESGIDYIELYIDGEMKYNFTSEPYTWMWSDNRIFGIHRIKAVAYDFAGNYSVDEVIVWKIL